MMEVSWLQAVLDWVQLHPHVTGWIIFIIALGESLLLVGLLLPGAALLIGLGTLIGLGVVDLQLAWITASLGAFVGDGISFWIGRHYQQGLLKVWPMYKFPKLIDQGQTFFTKWGALSVFVGRFVGFVRPIIPAIAGMMAMSVKKYISISAVASILWAPFYLLPGMLFGSAIGEMTKVAGKLALLFGLFIVTVAFFYWLIQLIYGYLLPRAHRLLSKSLIWSQKHPHLGKITSGLIDPRKPEKGSLAFMATFIIAITVVSLIFIINSDTVNHWSLQVNGFMQAFHTDWTQPVMLFLLAITHDLSIFIPSIMVFLWLLRRKRIIAAWHWFFIVVTGFILALFIQYFSDENIDGWFGFHHLSWFVAVMAFWSALISGALPHHTRSWTYTLTTVLIAVVAFTQLFFNHMSLGVVLLSIFSGVFLASVVAIAYRMRVRKQLLGWPISAIFFGFQGVMIMFVLIFLSAHILQPKEVQYKTISHAQWITAPTKERHDWLNRAKQQFNLNYHGDIQQLQTILAKQGFTAKTPSAWHDIWQALRTDKNSDDFVIIPTTDKGKIETIILSKEINNTLLAVHLWQQAVKIDSSDKAAFAGYVRIHKVASRWGVWFWRAVEDKAALDEFLNNIKQNKQIDYNMINDKIFLEVNRYD
ncbi:MAG: DedA family protein [Proteobacteria bacterium]|nr:DedA family protein [Pseudomonadota bacterium]